MLVGRPEEAALPSTGPVAALGRLTHPSLSPGVITSAPVMTLAEVRTTVLSAAPGPVKPAALTLDVFIIPKGLSGASQVAQWERTRLPMQGTQVRSLGQEDPLEEEMAAHSSILAGESQGQRVLVSYSPRGRKETQLSD